MIWKKCGTLLSFSIISRSLVHDDLPGGALAFSAGPELGALGLLSFGSEDGGGDGYGVWFGF